MISDVLRIKCYNVADQESETEDLVTVMWASEMLDKSRPDTLFEPV